MDFGSSHVYAGANAEVYYSSVPKEKQEVANAANNDLISMDGNVVEPIYESIGDSNKRKAKGINQSISNQPLPAIPIAENVYDSVPKEKGELAWDEMPSGAPVIPKKPEIYRSFSQPAEMSLSSKLRMALDNREKTKENKEREATSSDTASPPIPLRAYSKSAPLSLDEIPTLEPSRVEPPVLPPRDGTNEYSSINPKVEEKQADSASTSSLSDIILDFDKDIKLVKPLKPPPKIPKRRQTTSGLPKRQTTSMLPLHSEILIPTIVHSNSENKVTDTSPVKGNSVSATTSMLDNFFSSQPNSAQSSVDTKEIKLNEPIYTLSKTNPFSQRYNPTASKSSDLSKSASYGGSNILEAAPQLNSASLFNNNTIGQLYPTLPSELDIGINDDQISIHPEPSAPEPSATLTSLIRPSAPHLSKSMIKRDARNKKKPLKRSNSMESVYTTADTNIVCVKLGIVGSIDGSYLYHGIPAHCMTCGAIKNSSTADWECEFCGHANKSAVSIIPESAKHDITYVLQPPVAPSFANESLIVFCVDTSGSMCVTAKVESGTGSLFVSRLQGLKQAVTDQLNLIEAVKPNCRVALVTFNNEVELLGDGSPEQSLVFSEYQLFDFDYLYHFGSTATLPGLIKQTRMQLNRAVNGLKEKGGTALGPALLLSTSLASQRPGSQVIVCTDGRANVGLGGLETEDDYQMCHHFYKQVKDLAATRGVIVSIMSIAGTDCRLVQLGKVADKTAGKVSIVEASKLSAEFKDMISDTVLATNVSIDLVTQKQLYFNTEDDGIVGSNIGQFVGNITDDSEVTFRYGIRNDDEFKDIAPPQDASFQLKIMYRPPDGSVCMRVLTQKRPVTENRVLAESEMNPAVIGTYATQLAARLALDGDLDNARMLTDAHKSLLSRGMSLRSHAGSVRMPITEEKVYECVRSKMDDIGKELSKVDTASSSSSDDLSQDSYNAIGSIDEEFDDEVYEAPPMGSEIQPPALPPRRYNSKQKRMSSGASFEAMLSRLPTIPKGALNVKKFKKKNKQKTAMQYKDATAQKMFKLSKATTTNFVSSS